jgi:hypothetical protein
MHTVWIAQRCVRRSGKEVGLMSGVEVGAGGTPPHSHDYDFNDDVLDTAIAYFVNLVRTAMP